MYWFYNDFFLLILILSGAGGIVWFYFDIVYFFSSLNNFSTRKLAPIKKLYGVFLLEFWILLVHFLYSIYFLNNVGKQGIFNNAITVSVIFEFLFCCNSIKNIRRDLKLSPNTYINTSQTWCNFIIFK